MGLQAGGRRGNYEIVALLGTGGMGEVYRARDTKLNREVALKVLPELMARDSQRMARFEREAKTLASLNHSNIAAIYGLEASNGVPALVMELVEGETLEERIARSSSARSSSGNGRAGLQMDDCLNIAKQIAEALEYAHERGVIHRDLKPANVKITPEGAVKVLDFGLAKVLSNDDSASLDPSNSPTISVMATQTGIILGTAAYMPPEQAKGKQVDRRADIWAFGCVLYEMLSGKKPFEGETITDIIAAVVTRDPDWWLLPESTPPAAQRLLRRCLQKDPKKRLQAIGDARIAIEEMLSGEASEADAAIYGGAIPDAGRRSRLRCALPWAFGATIFTTIVFASIAAWFALQPKPARKMIQFSVAAPENTESFRGGAISLSPDGRYLAFVAQKNTSTAAALWVRALDSLTATEIPGTEGAFLPFWSPDSQWIGFGSSDKLKKVSVSDGALQTLCDAPGYFGGTLNSDGVILFSGNLSKLYQVPATGGTPTLVAAPDAAQKQTRFGLPQFLPDGRHFVAVVGVVGIGNSVQYSIATGSLDSKTVKPLVQADSYAVYTSPGELLYLEQNTLMARPFSARRLRFTGSAVRVAQNVGTIDGYGYLFASAAGVLAYQTVPALDTNQMTWFNRDGKKLGTVGQPGVYATPALSPDGTKLAVAVGLHPKTDIWVYDLKRGTASRLTFNAAYDVNPVWSPDGSQVLFSSTRSLAWGIFKKAADGLGSTEPVLDSGKQDKSLNDLTSDGRYAIYDTVQGPTQLWALPLFGDRKPFAFVLGYFGAGSAQFSPNGHYIAYASGETGRNEVYVQTFPQHTGRWEISTAGGAEPMWRRDGKELYYLTPDEKLMAVDVNTTSSTFQAGNPKELFKPQLVPMSYFRNIYVPSPDGQRFLMATPVSETKPEPITVVVNWQSMLKK